MPSNRPQSRGSANRRPSRSAVHDRASRPGGARRPAAPPPSAPTDARGALEHASLPILTFLTRLPRWLVGLVPGVLLLGGLLAPSPWGPMLLGLVTLFVGWLLALSWPKLAGRSRALRTVLVLGLVAFTVGRATGVL